MWKSYRPTSAPCLRTSVGPSASGGHKLRGRPSTSMTFQHFVSLGVVYAAPPSDLESFNHLPREASFLSLTIFRRFRVAGILAAGSPPGFAEKVLTKRLLA